VAQTFEIFVDTNVVTFYPSLEKPERFFPPEREIDHVFFSITLPVVRELERIKDEHWSEGQRERARALLDKLEDADRDGFISIGENCDLRFRFEEPNETQLHGSGFNLNSPDDQFIASVYWARRFATYGALGVLSADVGVRVRAKHQLTANSVYAPEDSLRIKSDVEFNLPQLMKATLKELAKELAEELRRHPG